MRKVECLFTLLETEVSALTRDEIATGEFAGCSYAFSLSPVAIVKVTL